MNLCRGQPPRSGIERELKWHVHLACRQDNHQDTAIGWVRSHIGVPSNEEVGALTPWHSYQGQASRPPRTATEGGLRATSKKQQALARRRPTLRLGTAVNWPRPALSTYTLMQTERGPQRNWLHYIAIGKAEDPSRPCDGTTRQTGAQITLSCPLHQRQRARLLQGGNTWEELDTPKDLRVDINVYKDGVRIFFSYLFSYLT